MTRCPLSIAVLVAAAFAFTGCVADNGEDEPPAPAPNRLSCSAQLSRGLFTYEVGDTGRMLTLVAGPDEVVLDRVSTPTGTIYGTWLLSDTSQNGVKLHAEAIFETGRMRLKNRCTQGTKTATAEASSAATISDVSVEVLEPDTDVKYSN